MTIYEELGVKTIINCAGAYTVLGGSCMSEASLKAMCEAGRNNVVLRDLQKAVFSRIAQLTYNEDACVTPGAMAGIYLTIASCISKKHGKAFKYIPKESIQNSEVIMFRAHRNPYDRGLEILNVKLVEVGYPNNIDIASREELENAITDRTTAILYLPSRNGNGGWVPPGALDFETTVQVAKERGIPVIVDAAAQLPLRENLWKFNMAGASATLFSGGKDLRGPQTTGLVLGKHDLLKWLHINNFPNYGVGRIHKVGREELAAIYTAVKEYMSYDEEARINEAERMVSDFVHSFGQNDCFRFERSFPNEAGQPIVRAKMIINGDRTNALQIQQLLADNERTIVVMIENESIYINTTNLSAQDAEYVLEALKKINQKLKENEA